MHPLLKNIVDPPLRILDKGDAHMTLKEKESVSQFNEGLKFDGEGYEALLLRKGDAHH